MMVRAHRIPGMIVLIALATIIASSTSVASPASILYTVTDLGPGVAFAVNSRGEVAGRDPEGGGAFLWHPIHGRQFLGFLPGGTPGNTIAFGVNDYCEVVGTSNDRAFIWDRVHGMRDLGTLPGRTSALAYAINNAGQVVGQSWPSGSSAFRAFIWDEMNDMRELDVLPGGSDYSVAFAINHSSIVAGSSLSLANVFPEVRAVTWQRTGAIFDLGVLASQDFVGSESRGINSVGQVVGYDGSRAFVWDAASGKIDLGEGRAFGISNSGTVVGDIGAPGAWIWTEADGRRFLTELLAGDQGQTWRITFAFSTNSSGSIVGAGEVNTSVGNQRAILLTPIRN